MSLEIDKIELRKKELQVELKKVETQLVEVLSSVELLKQKKFSLPLPRLGSWTGASHQGK